MTLDLAMVFLAVTLKAQVPEEKIDKLTSSKLKTLWFKGHYQKVKNDHSMGKKYLQIIQLVKVQYPEYLKTTTTQPPKDK